MKLLWVFVKKYKKLLALALGLATINQVFSLLDPQVFRLIIDKYASKAGTMPPSEFIKGTLGLLLLAMGAALMSRIAKNFQDYFVNVITQRVGTDMYAKSVDHSFRLPFYAFEDQRSGELLSKLQKARTDAQVLIQNSVNLLFVSVIGIFITIGYAFYVHWSIGLIFLLTIPTLGIFTFWISRKIKDAQTKIVKETAALAGSTTETLRNVELVKSLGLEKQEIDRLNAVNQEILKLELKKVKMVRTLSFIQGTLINTLRSSIMLLMLYLVGTQQITLGEFFSLLFYSFFIFNPLSEMGTVATAYQEASASMERVDEVLKTEPEKQPEHPLPVADIETITFKDVSFAYAGVNNHAVNNMNLSARAGETIAFAGPSGAGKTTIIKLLVGLYKPTSGDVLYNNTSVNEIDLVALRNRIGLVSQDTQLFSGTIRENLLFVRPSATEAEMLASIKAAAADNILTRSNEGLETKIGEGGLKLSGGEKQRLAIARALLRQPDLIIFDEATSSLDSLTEEEITETIKNIKHHDPNLLTVLIAHRLSTIAHADRIYVLEKGKLTEQGNHAELLEQKGLYAAMWRQQTAEK